MSAFFFLADVRRRPLLALLALLTAALGGPRVVADDTAKAPGGGRPVASWARVAPVDFESEILPIFQRNCLACHNQSRAKGDLNLETPQAALQGGSSGAGLVPGRAEESLIFRAAAHLAADMVMPPVGNKVNALDLSATELALLKAWIDQGARGEVRGGQRIAWSAMPAGWSPGFAVAISEDGRSVAVSRAHRVDVYETATRRRVAQLEDAAVPAAAHRDVVNALAFSPDGQWLASAGFREVKLWRATPARPNDFAGAPDTSVPWISHTRARMSWVQAAGTADGVVLVMDDSGVVSRTLHVGNGRVEMVALSPDGLRVAALMEPEDLVVADVGSGVSWHATVRARAVRSLVWLGHGRELAAVIEGSGRLERWRIPEEGTVAGELERQPGHEVMEAALVAGGNIGSRGEHVYFIGSEGTAVVLDAQTLKTERRVESSAPAVAGVVSDDLSRAAFAAADGVLRVRSMVEEGARLASDLAQDSGGDVAVLHASQRVEFHKSEVGFQKAAQQRAEEEVKSTGDILAKATARHAENEKTRSTKLTEWKANGEARAVAEKERTDLAAAMKQAEESVTVAEARVTEMKLAARQAAAGASEARTSAELASRTRSDLSRIVAEFAEKAEAQAAAKVSAITATAEGEAEQKRKGAEEAEAKVVEQLDALAAAATASGLARARLDRAKTELPPQQKAVDEKLAALTKAAGDLEAQVKKAEIGVSTSADDVTLARNQVEAATRRLAEAKAARERHESALPPAEASFAEAQAEMRRHASSLVDRVAFSEDASLLIAARASGRVQVWDVVSGGLRDAWTPQATRDTEVVMGVGIDSVGTAWTATARGLKRRPFVYRWELVQTLGGDANAGPAVLQDRVNALVFSQDGRTLFTAGGEPTRGGELKAWSIPEGTLVRDFGAVHSDAILAVTLSPDGQFVLTGGADRFMRCVERSTGRVVRQFEGHMHHVMGVAWLRDGRTVASAGADAVVKLWNSQTGDRLRNVDGFGKEVVAVQPVGVAGQFVAASGAGLVRVFKTGGETVRALEARGAFLHALAVTSDGRLAAAGDALGVLRIWSIDEGKILGEWAAAD